jgi:pSer/pThr/pTyr-binding forkhead associated (FHA) protein
MTRHQPRSTGCRGSALPVNASHIVPRKVVGLFLLLWALAAISSTGRADEPAFDWDRRFPYSVYVVHITRTSTTTGPVDVDRYILHGTPPENGTLLTADGDAGYFINEAEAVGGPFWTPREVCNNVKGTPARHYDTIHVPQIGYFDCDELYCDEDCADKSGLQTWDRRSEYPECECICKTGYELRLQKRSLTCVPCDQVCKEDGQDEHLVEDKGNSQPNQCACTCEPGYERTYSGACEQAECPEHATSMALLQKRHPAASLLCPKERSLNRNCCCDEGTISWGGTCQRPVDIPPDRLLWGSLTPENVLDPNVVAGVLRRKHYQELKVPPATYQPDSYPPGTVVFWGVDGYNPDIKQQIHNPVAHISIVVNSERDQMEMAKDAVQVFSATGTPDGPGAVLVNPTYFASSVWIPPQGTKVKPSSGRLRGMPRGYQVNLNPGRPTGTDWNCYGFVKVMLERFVVQPDPGATLPTGAQARGASLMPMKDPPGIPFALELYEGAVYGRDLPLDLFLPGGYVELTNEYVVSVQSDGVAEISVLDGLAEYYDEGQKDSIRLYPEQRLVVQEGRAGEPISFKIRDLDQWWDKAEPSPSGGLGSILGGMTVAAILLAGSAAAVLLVRHRSHRRLAPAIAQHTGPLLQGRPPATRRGGSRGADWGSMSVVEAQAPPRMVGLDSPRVTLGRGTGSDVILNDHLVSRRHAQIQRRNEGAILLDLGSTNGTFVNGVRLEGTHTLSPGDVIYAGRTALVFGSKRRHPRPGSARRQVAVRSGQGHPPVLILEGRSQVTVGRSRENDLVIGQDPYVSRRHARIDTTADGHAILDLGSNSGLFVNGQRVCQARLVPGDRIRLGNTELVYQES